MSKLTVRGLSTKSKKERLVIDVAEDVEDISQYIVTDNTYDEDGKLSNLLRHYYRFSRKIEIKKGDIIALNTYSNSIGDYSLSKGKNGNPDTHHFYWGLDKDVWNNGGDIASIFKLHPIDSKKVN